MYKVDTTASGNILVEMTPKEWHKASILFRPIEDDLLNIGEELVRYRRKTGVGLDEMAKKLDITTNYVSLIEWGLARHITPQLRQRITNLVNQP